MSGSVLVLGNFDGVHRGHQAVLRQARLMADVQSLRCVVFTFDPHPSEVLGRGTLPKLTTLPRRVELLHRHGAANVVVEPFTMELAAWTPERFAEDLLAQRLQARVVVVGGNFRFGNQRAGDFDLLAKLGKNLGFEAVASEVASDELGLFSSTRARDAIASGDLPAAENVLGRRHALSGAVETGDQFGRTIGFPTANLGGVEEILPPHGVYAVVVDDVTSDLGAPTALAKGVMNIGKRPTVSKATATGLLALRIEVHLFDHDRDIYGRALRVHLVRSLRPEQKFAGLDLLKAQIALDVDAARSAAQGISPRGGAYG